MLYTKLSKAKKNIVEADWKPCIDNTPVVVRLNNIPLVKSGQGEGLTKWKGCAWKWERAALDIKK